VGKSDVVVKRVGILSFNNYSLVTVQVKPIVVVQPNTFGWLVIQVLLEFLFLVKASRIKGATS
jgi:hypothetical protein